jgi:hypothetical protein
MMLLGDIWLFGEPLSVGTAIFLLLALGLCLGFEFVNGFRLLTTSDSL